MGYWQGLSYLTFPSLSPATEAATGGVADEKGAARGSRPAGGEERRVCAGAGRREERSGVRTRAAAGEDRSGAGVRGEVSLTTLGEGSLTAATCAGEGVGHGAREFGGGDEAVAAAGLPTPLPASPAGRPAPTRQSPASVAGRPSHSVLWMTEYGCRTERVPLND